MTCIQGSAKRFHSSSLTSNETRANRYFLFNFSLRCFKAIEVGKPFAVLVVVAILSSIGKVKSRIFPPSYGMWYTRQRYI